MAKTTKAVREYADIPAGTVPINQEVAPDGRAPLYLKTHAGDFEFGDVKGRVANTPNGSIIVTFSGRSYIVRVHDVITRALRHAGIEPTGWPQPKKPKPKK